MVFAISQKRKIRFSILLSLISVFGMETNTFADRGPYQTLLCSSILSHLSSELPKAEDQLKGAAFTLGQLEAFKIHTLNERTTRGETRELLYSNTGSPVSNSARQKIAEQIVGIRQDFQSQNPNQLLKMGLTLNDQDQIAEFLQGSFDHALGLERWALEKNPNFLRFQNEVKPHLRLLLTTQSALLTSLTLLTAPHYPIAAPFLGFFAYFFGETAMRDYGLYDQTYEKFLTRIEKQLLVRKSKPGFTYFSIKSRIFPKMFDELKSTAGFSSDSIKREMLAANSRYSPVRDQILDYLWSKLESAFPDDEEIKKIIYENTGYYVTVDFLLETNNPTPEKVALHTYIRVTKDKPRNPNRIDWDRIKEKTKITLPNFSPQGQPAFESIQSPKN